MFSFEITKSFSDKKCRVGIIHTPHGDIETPNYVAVATQASVKAVSPSDLIDVGIRVIIANTYHLHLRPGEDLIYKFGGLHKFMGWDGPIMTDSGGFQVFSLGFGMEHGVGKIANIFPEETEGFLEKQKAYSIQAKLASIDDDGVEFKSHLNGELLRLNPEISIEIQRKLGADIILAFDECTSPLHDYEYTKQALERTHNWAVRSIKAKRGDSQAIFGIVQGGHFKDLRENSAKFISSLEFDGFAIGGDLGRNKDEMHSILDWVLPLLPDKKPRHLLGIGEIEDIFEGVERGIDTFDCVTPTRLARCGQALVHKSFRPFEVVNDGCRIDLTGRTFTDDDQPIETDCGCSTCLRYSRAYLGHLFKSKELLGYNLLTIHNLYFMSSLMKNIRESIAEDSFEKLKENWLK